MEVKELAEKDQTPGDQEVQKMDIQTTDDKEVQKMDDKKVERKNDQKVPKIDGKAVQKKDEKEVQRPDDKKVQELDNKEDDQNGDDDKVTANLEDMDYLAFAKVLAGLPVKVSFFLCDFSLIF